jgi:hypothetical protein
MNANDLFKAVMQLDLEPIKMKLMHVASGEGWSLEKANAVEKEYRRFLCLMKMYPEEDTAPLVDVDTFWHYHILDTMKYAADCEQAFGYFLHHYPYVGMRGDDDEQFRLDSGNRMRELYEATFGEAYPGMMAEAEDSEASMAYCAGPHIQALARSGEGAVSGAAYCAGPHVKAKVKQAETATAYCAGPHANTAYCAGPHVKAKAKQAETATAYCAGPHVQAKAGRTEAATAYCAGPHANTAYCAGPHVKAKVKQVEAVTC